MAQSQVFGEYQTMFIFILVSAYNHIIWVDDISRHFQTYEVTVKLLNIRTPENFL